MWLWLRHTCSYYTATHAPYVHTTYTLNITDLGIYLAITIVVVVVGGGGGGGGVSGIARINIWQGKGSNIAPMGYAFPLKLVRV